MRAEEYYHFKQFKRNLYLNTKKRTFKMTNSSLGVISAEVIAYQIMRSNLNFAHYQLSNNNLLDEGVSKLCDVIDETNHIVSLDVSMNKLTSVGAERLSRALVHN
jgi:hypothetical protein